MTEKLEETGEERKKDGLKDRRVEGSLTKSF
jgi:hypothetical protein